MTPTFSPRGGPSGLYGHVSYPLLPDPQSFPRAPGLTSSVLPKLTPRRVTRSENVSWVQRDQHGGIWSPWERVFPEKYAPQRRIGRGQERRRTCTVKGNRGLHCTQGGSAPGRCPGLPAALAAQCRHRMELTWLPPPRLHASTKKHSLYPVVHKKMPHEGPWYNSGFG